jgi:predicted RNase H-like nuclease
VSDRSAALGVDAAGGAGWVGVLIGPEGWVGAVVHRELAALVAEAEALAAERGLSVDAVGVDIPIGLVDGPRRGADVAARELVGVRRSSVFWAPHRSILDVAPAGHAAANDHLGALGVPKVSAQAWNLVPRIAEATALAVHEPRLHEVFPEASFRMLAGHELAHPKRTAAGALARLALLGAADPPIHLPAAPEALGPAGSVALDDLFDAGAAAWSARRVARGEALALGAGERDPVTGHRIAVWV